ncbi:MAG: serine hydrolase domain-containing protein [Erythrobacter sp.]|uniref:serine hydrolase domain-containing protein n=1 Tax=Erythrobacter sp. TaxID=1042 RepID=UPI0032973382
MIKKLSISLVVTLGLGLGILAQFQTVQAQDDEPLTHDIPYLAAGLIPLEDRSKLSPMRETIEERMAEANTPGVAVAVIKNGKVDWAGGFGTAVAGKAIPVDENSVFSAGSVSKLVNAALIFRLVDEGVLDLDADVNTYLSSWKVPQSEFTRTQKVTLRRLLSHSAGINLHGFGDFDPGERLPTVIQTLNGASPAKHDPIEILFEPGSAMKYSGGGITISQLVVTDVTGQTYEEAARRYVFDPLGMSRSTFANPLPEDYGNIAYAHGREGRPAALPRGYESMPEVAASGLWTSAADMGKFLSALLTNDGFLSEELRTAMFTRQPNSWHGLGPRVNGADEKHVIHHGRSNNSYQSWFEAHPHTGDGVVVLTNGAGGRTLAYEVRISLERELGWQVNFPDDFDEPEGLRHD